MLIIQISVTCKAKTQEILDRYFQYYVYIPREISFHRPGGENDLLKTADRSWEREAENRTKWCQEEPYVQQWTVVGA